MAVMSITDLITASGMSREQICDETGLSRPMLSMIEKGKRRPGADGARKLARVLGVRLIDIRPDLADLAEIVIREGEAGSAA